MIDLSAFDPRDPLAESDTRRQLRLAVRDLVEREAPPERVRRLDEAEQFDDELYERLAAMGVLAIDAPAELGGEGDVRDQLVVIEEVAAGPTSMAAFLIVQFMVVQVLSSFAATDEQRAVLRELVNGRTKVSFALSEPDGGTDIARAMRTRAVRDGGGDEAEPGGGWRISGRKQWTSGATNAQWLIVLARTREPQGSSIDGVTMFFVPTDARGVEIREIETFGIHGLSTCEVVLDEVVVPDDAVLGVEHAGFRQAFATLNREGLIACAACLGVGRAALTYAASYTGSREVFGRPIGSFQVPQHWLADAAVRLEAARSFMIRAAEIEVQGGNAEVLAHMAKLTASEAAQDVALKGMQLMGGYGYSRELPMQRWFRDVRLWNFAPLNNEMVRNRIAERLLGLPRSY
jgi:alkylation response protein AidB-like acyl-CoA dehydrogenase